MLKRTLTLLLFVAAASVAAASGDIPWRTPIYSLVARSMNVREALDAFGIAQGIGVVMSQGVSGEFSGDFKDMPADEFLSRVTAMHNLTWYYDGAALYVYGAGEIETTLVDLAYMKAGEVREMLRELGVEDERFPLKTTSNDELVLVSGPPRYVQLVLATIAKADKLRELRTYNEIETRIFPIANTWADDVSLDADSPEGSCAIKGVATLLREMMESTGGGKSRDAVTTNSTLDTLSQKMGDEFKPTILSDPRLNAVIVRDIASRMPMYERLIEQLDVPVPLVEISITILELSKEDALDWELELKGQVAKKKLTAAAGQVAGNLVAPDGIGGTGLAGALTYLGHDFNLAASLTALKQKGKARTISRPTLITLNNIAAEMTDTQSYHARVINENVASLEAVSAGIEMRIKPRIVPAKGSNSLDQVWLSLEIIDGGFESVAVDSMPMTRNSEVTTQAAVYEGDAILVGGYLRDIVERKSWGIPILRSIPLIGWLFGGTSSQTTTVQRMFIVTPYIVTLDQVDLARIQATRQRNVQREEKLEDDLEEDSSIRELRNQEREERIERRRQEVESEVARRKAELRFTREKREAELGDVREDWQDDIRRRRDQWLKERQAAEEAKKAAADKAAAEKKAAEEAKAAKWAAEAEAARAAAAK